MHSHSAEKLQKIRASLSPDTLRLLETTGELSEKLNLKAALVGGPIRDLLLGLDAGEIDCTVEGTASGAAAQLGRALAKRLKGKLTVYPRFLTCRVALPGGRHIDLATARAETYPCPGALPAVSPSTIEADLKRRDFSINAIAVRIDPRGFGALLDPFGGAADLENRTLRVLHAQSFTDDPTRIFRGVRFASRYGLKWERGTRKLLLEALDGGCLDTVSGERVKKEWRLLLSEESRIASILALRKFDIAARLADGLRVPARPPAQRDNIRAALGLTEAQGAETWLIYTMSLLAEADEAQARAFMKRLSFTGRERRAITEGLFLSAPVRRAARDSSARLGNLYLLLSAMEREAAIFILASETSRASRDRLRKCLATPAPRPRISGKDLRALGYAPSPAFKTVFDEILQLKVEGKVKTRRQELAAAKKILGG